MSTKLQRIKTMLSELLQLEMSSATSDKGIIYWNDDELKEGTVVYVQDDNEIKVLAEDGDYEVEGKVITVSEGKVIEIKDKIVPVEIVPVEVEPEVIVDDPETVEDETPVLEEEPKDEEEVVEEEPKDEEKPADDPETEEDETPEMEDVENPTNEGEESDTKAIVEIRKEVNELYAIIDQLKKEIEELKGKPLAMSAVETLENVRKTDKGLKGIDRYAQAIADMRK